VEAAFRTARPFQYAAHVPAAEHDTPGRAWEMGGDDRLQLDEVPGAVRYPDKAREKAFVFGVAEAQIRDQPIHIVAIFDLKIRLVIVPGR
jgi:hypothetical protein